MRQDMNSCLLKMKKAKENVQRETEGNQRNTQNYQKLVKFIRLENTYMQIRVLK